MRSCPNCGNEIPPGSADCPSCATMAFASPRPGLQISGYDILGRIGEGGMGAIYLAEEKALGRRVAIKVISGKIAEESQARTRFLREARALATVEHANVVRIYAFGEVEGQPYLAMEYVDGETLAEKIRREKRLPVDDAVRFTRQILLALDAAWEKGIVHRDMKPSNVIVDRRDLAHVVDFGLAKSSGTGDENALTQSGHVLGTPYYVSPEQAQGHATDFRSDIYSCGIMLYEMLAGERPFEGTTPFAIVAKHLQEPLPSIRAKRSDVPGRVAVLIERMTEKRPERRPQSYGELLAAFDELLGITPSRPVSATTTFTSAPVPIGLYRAPAILFLAIAAALVGVMSYRVRTRLPPSVAMPAEQRLVIAVAPFYGPDEESAREGRVMAAMVERSIATRLGAGNVRVAGIDETKDPVRTHEAARALGEKLGAAVVVWGEAFALRRETEIQPYFTIVRRPASEEAAGAETSREVDLKAADPVAALSEQKSGVVRVAAEAPNQIDLRKTSAEGAGEMVSFLAGLYALYTKDDPMAALQFFQQAPETAEVLRHRAEACFLRAQRPKLSTDPDAGRRDAAEALERALALEPDHAQANATLADLYAIEGRYADAARRLERAAASGQPFVARYAILSGDRLYVRELFAPPEEKTYGDTGYLLAIDPRSGRVLRRFRLPGVIQSLRPSKDGFTVTYAIDRSGAAEQLTFANGRFDRPLLLGGDLHLRMRGIKSGWALAHNFIDEFTSGTIGSQPAKPRFRLAAGPLAGRPASLPELESALRAAADRDPTQPWHLFFLGHALAAQGRPVEADAVWRQLVTRTDFGVMYVDYNWMARFFERLGYPQWADRMFERGRRERNAIPQPVIGTTLIERMVNVSFMRLHPEQMKDPNRAYTLLVRAREASGMTEADQYAAAAWSAWFRRSGDVAKARAEEEFRRRAAAHSFNYTAHATLFDYAIYMIVATWLSLLVAGAIVVSHACRRAGVAPLAPLRWWIALHRRVARWWLPFLVGFELAIAFVVFFAIATQSDEAVAVVLTVVAFVAGLVVISLANRRVVEQIRPRERVALLLAMALFLPAAVFFAKRVTIFTELAGLPIGLSDSLGHPALISDVEKRLKLSYGPDIRYVAAVSNDLGGRKDRAKSLYRTLPDDDRARRAVAAIDAGRSAITMPSADELIRAYGQRAWFGRGSGLGSWGESGPPKPFFLLLVTALFGAVLLLAFLFVRPAGDEPPPPATRSRKRRLASIAAFLLLPGIYDLRRRSPVRGVVTFMLFIFVLLLAVVGWKASAVFRSPGILTSMSLPNIVASSPMPPDWSPADLMFAPPYARLFWGFVAVAAAALLVLHATRIAAIVRLDREAG